MSVCERAVFPAASPFLSEFVERDREYIVAMHNKYEFMDTTTMYEKRRDCC